MDGLPMLPAYLYVNSCSAYLAYLLHPGRHRHHRRQTIVIVAIHLLFKRNIYLSLYVIGILFLKINFFFLSSKYAVEACDINNCC